MGTGLTGIFGGVAALWLIGLGIVWILEGVFGQNLHNRYIWGTGRLLRSMFFWTGYTASDTVFHGHRAGRRNFPRVTAAIFAILVLTILYRLFGGR